MSLSSSIANAVSGLNVTSRSAQLVSSNLANALNEAHSRRDIEIESTSFGGATVSKIGRFADRALEADLQKARASLGHSSERASGANKIESFVGNPSDPYSIAAQITKFDSSLRFLESDPSSDVRLQEVVSSAKSLSSKLNATQDDIQQVRLDADRQISSELKNLNANLNQIAKLNVEIVSANVNGRDPSSLLDHRQSLVDSVSELIPVRQMQREHDAISLLSTKGTMLVESSAVQFEFTNTNLIMPHMSATNGMLGTLSVAGDDIDMQTEQGPLSGGRLQALFSVRDQIAPDAQDQLDAFAMDLANSLQDLPNDITTTVADAGLFTDNGQRTQAGDQVGLAGRITLNASVDPAVGGEYWRLRSGLQASAEGPVGDASLISDMINSLSQQRTTSGSIIDHAADLSSQAALRSSLLESDQSFASVQFEQLNQMHLENGVNTDSELQKLLRIENNYAANAKVIQTIDEMFAAIMRIS